MPYKLRDDTPKTNHIEPTEGVRYYSEIRVFPMIKDGEGISRLINSTDTLAR